MVEGRLRSTANFVNLNAVRLKFRSGKGPEFDLGLADQVRDIFGQRGDQDC